MRTRYRPRKCTSNPDQASGNRHRPACCDPREVDEGGFGSNLLHLSKVLSTAKAIL